MPKSKESKSKPAAKSPGVASQALASGVAVGVGSAVGHVVGKAVTGDGSQQQQKPGRCEIELQEFLDCALRTNDLAACSKTFENLRGCVAPKGIYGATYAHHK